MSHQWSPHPTVTANREILSQTSHPRAPDPLRCAVYSADPGPHYPWISQDVNSTFYRRWNWGQESKTARDNYGIGPLPSSSGNCSLPHQTVSNGGCRVLTDPALCHSWVIQSPHVELGQSDRALLTHFSNRNWNGVLWWRRYEMWNWEILVTLLSGMWCRNLSFSLSVSHSRFLLFRSIHLATIPPQWYCHRYLLVLRPRDPFPSFSWKHPPFSSGTSTSAVCVLVRLYVVVPPPFPPAVWWACDPNWSNWTQSSGNF